MLEAKFLKAINELELKRYEQSKKTFQQLSKIDISKAEGYYGLGLVDFDQDNLDLSYHYFAQSVLADSNFLDSYAAMARIHINGGEMNKAQSILQKGLARDTNWQECY